jgi:hypothetical protein
MKKYSFFALMVIALLIIVVGGCSKESPTSINEGLELIDQEFGGYTIADETPDNDLVADFAVNDESSVDGISENSQLNGLNDSSVVNYYHVRIIWGKLNHDSTATQVINWNGSASVNKGTLTIMRKIRFENLTDYIVHPRTDKKSVQWVSQTITDFDGIHFVIIDNDTANSSLPGEFTITVGAYTNTFSFAELDSMELVADVDNLGNQVAIVAFKKQVVPFAGGFLEGRWIRTAERGGRFWGRWINSVGSHTGYLKGIWGVDHNGNQVFYGKYTTLNGRFAGLLKGEWGFSDEINGKGWMKGVWVNANHSKISNIKAIWRTGKPNDRKGFFHGRWFKKS